MAKLVRIGDGLFNAITDVQVNQLKYKRKKVSFTEASRIFFRNNKHWVRDEEWRFPDL